MNTAVVVDAGPLVAILDRDDAHHSTCVDWFALHSGTVIVPAPVIVEVCWLLGRRVSPTAEAAFLSGLRGDTPHIAALVPAARDTTPERMYLRLVRLVRRVCWRPWRSASVRSDQALTPTFPIT